MIHIGRLTGAEELLKYGEAHAHDFNAINYSALFSKLKNEKCAVPEPEQHRLYSSLLQSATESISHAPPTGFDARALATIVHAVATIRGKLWSTTI